MVSIALTDEELESLRTHGYCGVTSKKWEAFQGATEAGSFLEASLRNGSSKCVVRVVASHAFGKDTTLSILVPALPPLP